MFQPYIDQAARDKTRADAEKADYEVSRFYDTNDVVSFMFDRKRALVAAGTARTMRSK